ncbi:glycosyltransferase [Zunongwangia sp.]|uniref:glycosyltransferase n=1 Tax=Zunongwangia sp. TaxID=1965325 RepID=UPI003AA811B2
MKIAIIADHRQEVLPPYKGGLAMITHKLYKKLEERGHEVRIFSNTDCNCQDLNYLDNQFSEYDCFPCNSYNSFDASAIKSSIFYAEIFQHLRDYEYDIVQNHSLHYLPIVLGNNLNTNFITTIHTLEIPDIKFALNHIKKSVNQELILVSKCLQNRQTETLNANTVIHNAIDLEDWSPQTKVTGGYCMWYGSFCKQKAPHLAVEVALKAGMPIILAGRGKNTEYFKRFIEPLLKNSLVSYVGEQKQKQLNKLLNNAAALLFTSVWNEPSALAISESLASGTPVLSWNIGVAPELIIPEVGKLFEPLDTTGMAETLKNIGNFNRKKCRDYAEKNCNIENTVDAYLNFYETLQNENVEAY